MKTLIRICYWFVMRSLERQFYDELRCMKECSSRDTYWRIYMAHQVTRKELAKARSSYVAMLPVGKRKTWADA